MTTVTLDSLSNSTMTGIYNQITGSKLSKFRDHATAVRRLNEVLEREGSILISSPEGVQAVPVESIQTPVEQPKKRGRGRPRAIELNQTIRVHATGANRRRWGSTQKLFDLHVDGLTVAQYLTKAQNNGFKLGQAYNAVRRDVHYGDITVS